MWRRWQAAAGPWQGWNVCPALLAPEADDIVPRAAPRPDAARIAAQLAPSLAAGGTLLILDLEPVLGVAVAARLSHARLANPMLVLPRWPYPRAVLPVDALLHALISHAPHLAPEQHLPNVACVLDADRARPIGHRPAADDRADNRYRVPVSELPDLAALRARGVQRVVRIFHPAPGPARQGRVTAGMRG